MQAWVACYLCKAEKRRHCCRYAGKGTRTHPRSYANHLMRISTCVSVRGNSHRSRVWMRRQVQPSMQCQSQPCSMPRWNKQQMQRHVQERGETSQLANHWVVFPGRTTLDYSNTRPLSPARSLASPCISPSVTLLKGCCIWAVPPTTLMIPPNSPPPPALF